MKNIFYALLLFSVVAHGQIVNIPDPDFKAYLLSANATTNLIAAANNNNTYVAIDTNGDSEIQVSEAAIITTLTINNQNIVNTQGIEAFINLKNLTVYYAPANINLTSLTNLVNYSNPYNNQITNLDFSGLSFLKQIYLPNCLNLNSLNIQGCSALERLTCFGAQLTSINLTGLTNLKYIDVGFNQITDIVATDLPLLTDLNFEENHPLRTVNIARLPMMNNIHNSMGGLSSNPLLETVNIIDCPLLTTLNIDSNSLTTIDCHLTGLTNLKFDGSLYNTLQRIDLSGCSALQTFGNNIGELNSMSLLNYINLTGCQALNRFTLNNCSSITSVDLSPCINLNNLNIQNNASLEYLFIKNGRLESNVTINNNFLLRFICADVGQINSIINLVEPSVTVNSYCSFTPGGDYNTITGKTQYDLDNNGCDANDLVYPYVKINLSYGINQEATFTNQNGAFTFYTQAGNFNLTPQTENPTWFNFSPANASLNFPVVNNSTQTQNFCITPNGIHPDLEVILSPIGPARPGFNAYYKIVYKNKGNQTLSGQVNLTFDDARMDYISAAPIIDGQAINTLNWNFNSLTPLETRSIMLNLNIHSPTDVPAVHAGDILNFTTSITQVSGEETPLDNTFELNQPVVNSYDPNDKTCLEGNTIAASEIGKYVHYNINFENIGTSEAINIVVKDTINLQMFDINSLQLLYASHPVETKIRDGIVEFIFRGIHLPPSNGGPIGGHGNVLFKIKTLPTLQVGDEIANTANIFFDYNHPIETNEARSAYTNLSQSVFTQDESIDLLPNPTKDKATVSALNALKSIEIYDVQGRLLQTIIDHGKTKTIDLSSYSRGIYWVKINTEKGSAVQKLIKE